MQLQNIMAMWRKFSPFLNLPRVLLHIIHLPDPLHIIHQGLIQAVVVAVAGMMSVDLEKVYYWGKETEAWRLVIEYSFLRDIRCFPWFPIEN